jgi:hypothetical protein
MSDLEFELRGTSGRTVLPVAASAEFEANRRGWYAVPMLIPLLAASWVVLAQAPAQPAPKVKVEKGTARAKALTQKTQAELDAEAKREDEKLRCADDPSTCGQTGEGRAKELSAKEQALRAKEAELAAREEALRKKQEEEKDEKEQEEKRKTEQKKQVDQQGKQIQQIMQGLGGALSGE